jgi:uncharacterized protein (TIGR03435 family)
MPMKKMVGSVVVFCFVVLLCGVGRAQALKDGVVLPSATSAQTETDGYTRSELLAPETASFKYEVTATTASPRSFEVASVRASQHGCGTTSISPWGGARFSVKGATMQLLLSIAFDVRADQISSKLGLDTQCYDVDAKPEGDTGLSYEEVKAPLQQLLAERFHLAFHRENKDVSGYALVIAKSGLKLQQGKDVSASAYIMPDGLRGEGMSMNTLAAMLSSPVGQQVVDKTGITGNYDIDLKYAPSGATESQYPSIFTAVQEQLGLKLEPQKLRVEMLVIDHLEKMPSEN